MQLDLPIFPQLANCKNLLIAGMGGGFDIFCGLPIYFELQRRQLTGNYPHQQIHLANLSFSEIAFTKSSRLQNADAIADDLIGVNANIKDLKCYFPELYLTHWFRQQRQQEVTIWCMPVSGVQPLLASYRKLVTKLDIDGILLIDGGVDSLMRGDETGTGTLMEDAISLAAINQLTEVPVRLMGCIGLGAERDISYAHVLENIAALAEMEGFLGSCSLIKQMPAYQAYEEAVLYTQSQRYQDPSVINSSIVSAVQGHYGNYHLTDKTKGSQLWISPLMSMYWFFDLSTVVKRHLFLRYILWTNTFWDAMVVWHGILQSQTKRPHERIPLT